MNEITPALPTSSSGQPTDVMLNKTELAKLLKVTLRTVENWQRLRALPYIKVGKIVLFHWPDVVEFLKANFRVSRRRALK